MNSNPILDFGIERATLKYVGRDLQRPECILAESDGTLWSADARGGVVRLAPDGRQEIVTQRPVALLSDMVVGLLMSAGDGRSSEDA